MTDRPSNSIKEYTPTHTLYCPPELRKSLGGKTKPPERDLFSDLVDDEPASKNDDAEER